MERIEIMDKTLRTITSGEIMDAMSDLDALSFNNGLGGLIRDDFAHALAFCLGLACGREEKGGEEA